MSFAEGFNSGMPNHCFELSTSETIWYEGTSSCYLTKRGPERSHSFRDKITVMLPRVQVGKNGESRLVVSNAKNTALISLLICGSTSPNPNKQRWSFGKITGPEHSDEFRETLVGERASIL